MQNKDQLFQDSVDQIRDELLSWNPEKLTCLEYYSEQEKSGIKIATWHHKLNENESHVVIQAQRRVFLFLWRNYLSGVIVKNLTQVDNMPDSQVANYD